MRKIRRCIQCARDEKEKLEIGFFELLVQSSEAYDTSVFLLAYKTNSCKSLSTGDELWNVLKLVRIFY